jgi:hypothetical protein
MVNIKHHGFFTNLPYEKYDSIHGKSLKTIQKPVMEFKFFPLYNLIINSLSIVHKFHPIQCTMVVFDNAIYIDNTSLCFHRYPDTIF